MFLSLPFMSVSQPPLKGEAARRAGGVSRGTQNTIQEIQGEFVQANPQAPLKGELPPQRLRGAVSGYVFAKTWANSYRPPLASPGGVAERSESFKIMIASGNHTLIQ